MPKIGKRSVTIYHKDMRRVFEFDMMYNGEHLFYGKIPNEFNDAFDHLSSEKLRELSAEKAYKRKFQKGEFSRIVHSNHEGTCESKMKELISLLMDSQIKKREVIVLFYDATDNCRYGDFEQNPEHPQIGLRMGLTYCVETTLGDKCVYNIYTEREAFGEKRVDRKEIRLTRGCVVIDDNPKNREFLENIYIKMSQLNNNLALFTKDKDSLLDLIESNQKLLG